MNYLYALVATAIVALAVKKIPALLANEEDKLIKSFLDTHGPEDDELMLAVIKWADKKVPGGNNGHLKYQAAANMISARFPMISADKLDELIEGAVDQLKIEAEKNLPPAGAPPSPGS